MTERLTEGEWVVEFSSNHLREYLARHGEMPLPTYIKRPSPSAQVLDRYQTVYAKEEGAVAAPTAGFHFTAGTSGKVRAKGVSDSKHCAACGLGNLSSCSLRDDRRAFHAGRDL